MITQLLLEVLAFIPNMLLSALGVFEFTLLIPQSVYDGIHMLTGNLGYLFPVGAIFPILVFSVWLRFARAMWALVIRIKSFIPTMGA